MYTIKNPYNKNKYSQLKLFKMIASGGAGQIYKTNLKNVVAKLGETRIATAANMLGHSVLVPGKIARADDDGSVNGVIDLPSASTNVNVAFKSQNGEIIDTINLGNQSSGLVGFAWHGAPKDMIENEEPIFVEAYANS